MSFDFFSKILDKARQDGVRSIDFFNWTEPLLHPEVGKFISITRSSGIATGISTNLNIIKNLESCIKANPTSLRISVSGYSQETYSRNHVGGDIDTVKNNMMYLAELKERYCASTRIEVAYLRYLDNMDDEASMRKFSEQLGFKFTPTFAALMPMEKALAAAEGRALNQSDKNIQARVALPINNKTISLAQKYKSVPCTLKDEMLTLDCEGNVILCCTLYEQKKVTIGKYLDLAISKIQDLKNNSPQCVEICSRCTSNGFHAMAQYSSRGILATAANNNAINFYANRLGLPFVVERVTEIVANEFNEDSYLEANPDVALAVLLGRIESGYRHYLDYGSHEKRPLTKKSC